MTHSSRLLQKIMIAFKVMRSALPMMIRTFCFLLLLHVPLGGLARAEGAASVPVVYPKDNSIVGQKLNVVLDPLSDWSAVPFFQVVVNGTEYPPVDTSTGKHAFQGVELEPGMNAVIVKVLAPAGKKGKGQLQAVSSREIKVFCLVDLFTTRYAPAGYAMALFHSRENEESCAGCHALDAPVDRGQPKKPEEVICYACHRAVPTGKHIHGPAAVWNCLGCHDPDLYPVKYQFTAVDSWRASKSVQAVVPMTFTFPSEGMFKPLNRQLNMTKEAMKDLFKDVLAYAKQNPGEIIRVEVHSDNSPIMSKYYKSQAVLSSARARTLAAVLKEFGVNPQKIRSFGMGSALPKASNTTADGRAVNNRIEVVIHPPDLKIKNSMTLPVIRNRDRVLINLSYSQGPQLKRLRVVEKIPKGTRYLPASAYFAGVGREPRIRGDSLVWEFEKLSQSFQETLSYVLVKQMKSEPVSEVVSIAYAGSSGKDAQREFDLKHPVNLARTVNETCERCHPKMLDAPYRHGPPEAGYCNLCHDPHASPYSAWLRKGSWELCTTCHDEKKAETHVLSGAAKRLTHPTRARRDPARPGKRFSCTSCHESHSAQTSNLYKFEARSRIELCGICHRQK